VIVTKPPLSTTTTVLTFINNLVGQTPTPTPTPKPASSKKTKLSVPGLINDRTHCTVFVGRKGSGKSFLCCRLLKTIWKDCYEQIIFISPTFESQLSLWGSLDPAGISVYSKLTDELIETLLTQQMSTRRPVLIVLDDNGEDFKKVSPNIVNKLVSNSRHINLSIIGLFQKLTQCPVILRANTDTFLSFSACSYLERECLWREVSIVSKQEFQRIFNTATENNDHGFLCSSIGRDGSLKFYSSDFTTELK
jgi:hypothetical protein